jgi:hypothetical protein
MRKQIDGLANIVVGQLQRDPADRTLYLFINRGRDKIKLLIWHLKRLLATVQAFRETTLSVAGLVYIGQYRAHCRTTRPSTRWL